MARAKGIHRRELKPRSKEELIRGIKAFWPTVTVAQNAVHWTLKESDSGSHQCDGAATGYEKKLTYVLSEPFILSCAVVCTNHSVLSTLCLLLKEFV